MFILNQSAKLRHRNFEKIKTTISAKKNQTAYDKFQTRDKEDQKLHATNAEDADDADQTTNAKNDEKQHEKTKCSHEKKKQLKKQRKQLKIMKTKELTKTQSSSHQISMHEAYFSSFQPHLHFVPRSRGNKQNFFNMDF